jgi:hypothetical protein
MPSTTHYTGTITDTELSRMQSPEVVARLREILGTKLVAYIAGVTTTRAVLNWVSDSPIAPSDEKQWRLKNALRIADYLRRNEGLATVQSWFMGMNTNLDDQAPAKLLRDGRDLAGDAARVFAAARSFEQA